MDRAHATLVKKSAKNLAIRNLAVAKLEKTVNAPMENVLASSFLQVSLLFALHGSMDLVVTIQQVPFNILIDED